MSRRSTTGTLPPTQRSLPIALIRAREKVMAPILDATDLAERAGLHQPSLTRILKALSERDFIHRDTDANDRRRQVVALSKAGRKVIDDNLDQATRIAEAIQASLGQERFDTLLDLLTALDDFSFDPAARQD